MAKLDRLLNLTATLLNTAVPLTAEEIRQRVRGYPTGDVAYHRAFERDKDELRALGYPVATVVVEHHEVPRTGYMIDKREYALSDPGFTPEELAVLQLARTLVMFEGMENADEVVDTFRKLGGMENTPEGSDPLGSLPISEEIAAIFEAINKRRVIGFDYAGTTREVEPTNLTFRRGHWYLTAFDRGRSEIRNFRTDRMSGSLRVGEDEGFSPRASDNDLVTTPWATGSGPPVTARVRVDREPATATLVEYPDLHLSRTLDDGSIEVTTPVVNREGFFGFMAGLLDRAEIVEPQPLREDYITWLRARLGGTGGEVRR